MEILIKAAQLILALVILVTIHEFGHYIFARIFGVKVNRFYMFFNPGFSLVRYNPMEGTVDLLARNGKKGLFTLKAGKPAQPSADGKTSWRDTIYGIGWLPLGGYCDIAGMVDETKGADQLESEPQQWELRSKKAWQRMCVMVAGVCFNFILAIIIYIGIAVHWGDDVIPFQAMTEGMDFSEEFQQAGFRNGDILMSIDGKPLDATDYSIAWDLIQPNTRVGVVRNGRDTTVTIPAQLIKTLTTKGKDFVPMTPRVPVVVLKTVPGEPAVQAGLAFGDRILKVGNDTVPTVSEFLPTLQRYAGKKVPFLVKRADGSTATMDVAVSEAGKIGIQMTSPVDIFEHERISYNILQAAPRGVEIGVDRLTTYVSSLSHVFSKEGAQSLGGFGTLGDLFPATWSWYSFWQITAFFSIILAFMNIIPIPGLDGGYTLFLIVEMITGRKPSDKFLEVVNTCGFVFLLLLMVYANGNDIYRFFIK